MPGFVCTAALQGLEVVPGGPVLGTLIGGLLDEIDRTKALKDNLETLRDRLPKRLAELKQCDDHEELVEKIVAQVKALNVFVQGCEKLSRFSLRKQARENRKEFKLELERFTTEMKELKDLVPVRTLHLTAQTNQTSNETLGNVKEVDRKVGELADGFNSVLPMLETWLTESAHGSEALSASEIGEQLQATLQKLRDGSDVEEAQKALVRIALKLVRDDNELCRTVGVDTLDELVAHPNARNFVMANPSTVRTLINLAMKHQEEKAQWLLEHLVERAAPFFEQLEPLSRIPKYLPTIAATGLVPWIVASAKPKLATQDRLRKRIGDENALRILLVMAKCDECKPAIAEAGGITALVDTYRLLPMSAEEVDKRVFDVIRALVGLAKDATCRAQFARAHGEWPLLHFVYRCATIPPRKYVYIDWLEKFEIDYDNDGTPYKVTVVTAFDRQSVQADTSTAGDALWELTTQDDGWKRRVLYLGALYSGGYMSVDGAVVESVEKRPRIDAILGWLCMAFDIDEKRSDERYAGCRGAFWSFPIVWSLLMDDATSFTVAEWCFGNVLCELGYDSCGDPIFPPDGALQWFGRNSYCSHWNCERVMTHRTQCLVFQSEVKLVSSISSYLALPKCKSLYMCWKLILLQLENEANEGHPKARSLSVLWVCGDLVKNLDPSDRDSLEKVCEKAVASGRVDDVFWAVCLLLSAEPARVSRMLTLAMAGVELLLESDEWVKFVFLAKYMLKWEAVHEQGPCSAPFLVTCFLRLRGGEEWLDDDSYFQAECYKSHEKTNATKKCLRRLGQLWLKYKTQIVKEGGAATLQAMLDCTAVDDSYKSDIRQELHAIATERGSSLTSDAAAP